MGPFRKEIDGAAAKIFKAVAYLKPSLPDDDSAPTIQLPYEVSPVVKALNRELLVAYLVDAGNLFEYIRHRDLKANGVTESELHEIGLHNLNALVESRKLRVAPHGNIFAVLLDGNFESSMILLDNLWTHSFRQFVEGDYLVALPNRDILAFCDRSSAAGRAELIELLARLKDSLDHSLTRNLYVRQNGNWVPENEA